MVDSIHSVWSMTTMCHVRQLLDLTGLARGRNDTYLRFLMAAEKECPSRGWGIVVIVTP